MKIIKKLVLGLGVAAAAQMTQAADSGFDSIMSVQGYRIHTFQETDPGPPRAGTAILTVTFQKRVDTIGTQVIMQDIPISISDYTDDAIVTCTVPGGGESALDVENCKPGETVTSMSNGLPVCEQMGAIMDMMCPAGEAIDSITNGVPNCYAYAPAPSPTPPPPPTTPAPWRPPPSPPCDPNNDPNGYEGGDGRWCACEAIGKAGCQ
mgnify:CR=1 FL=1